MKKLILLSAMLLSLPLSLMAQDDDMYFVPTKKNVEKANARYGLPAETYYSGSNRSVDDYNRYSLGSRYEVVVGDSAMRDVIDFSGEAGVYPDSTADFQLTRQMSRWEGYEPSEDYWNGYQQGRSDEWTASTWHSPWYYSSYYPWYDSWYDPWYRSSWYYSWYDPWYYRYPYYGWGWGGYYSGWNHHPVVSRSGRGYRNPIDNARSGYRGTGGRRGTAGSGYGGVSTSRGTAGRSTTGLLGSGRTASRSSSSSAGSYRSSSSSSHSTPSYSSGSSSASRSSYGSSSSSIGGSRSSGGGGSRSGGGGGSRSGRR